MTAVSQAIARVGIDAGGTFTDVVWVERGHLGTAKVPSRPDAPAEAVLAGLRSLPRSPDLICHGTTVGTNAVLARHGGPACMVVTRGFRDVLTLGRGERRELYSASPTRTQPLIGRDSTHEIGLRVDSLGNALVTPSEEEISDLAECLRRSGAKAVGLGILHSTTYPDSERALAGKLASLTGLDVFASSDLAAYPREYERWNLAALAAYLAPVLGAYLADLARRSPSRLALMGSSGGLLSSEKAFCNPAVCVLSGPAGGAMAALSLGRERVLALDMGGTSTDVTLLAGGLPRTREASIDELPLPLPTIDIHTIGAGGGSVIRIDKGGMLTVGPESAGASPGPACYGNGGPAALTDVALLSGRLISERFLGGGMPLDKRAAGQALEQVRPRGFRLETLIEGVLGVAQAHLTGALRRISIGRGIDPSLLDAPFTLVAFGGAGALFGAECAQSLGLRQMVHPHAAGVFSALGLLSAPIALERERAVLLTVPDAAERLPSECRELMSEIRSDLSEWSEYSEPIFTRTIECRYLGQTHTLEIKLPDPPAAGSLRDAFEAAYRARYTYLHPDSEIEVVSVRVRGELPGPLLELPDIDNRKRSMESAEIGATRLRLISGWREAPVYERARLPIESEVKGPALIVEDFATLYLPPDTSAHLDRKGHALIELG